LKQGQGEGTPLFLPSWHGSTILAREAKSLEIIFLLVCLITEHCCQRCGVRGGIDTKDHFDTPAPNSLN
jgi:hypothetical protein